MEPSSSERPLRLRHSNRLHQQLPIHHRLLRSLRRECSSLRHADPVRSRRRYGRGGRSVLREFGGAFYGYDFGVYRGAHGKPFFFFDSSPFFSRALRNEGLFLEIEE